MLDNKKQLTITLTEPVVFLRSSDPSGRHSDPSDPPTVVRGVLSLNVLKPIGISSINVELSGALTTQYSDGVASHRTDIQEKHKIYSSTVAVFRADHAPRGRRSPSGGPSVSAQNTTNDPDDCTNLSYLGESHRERSERPAAEIVPPANLGPTPIYSPSPLSPGGSADMPEEPRQDSSSLEGSFEQPRPRPHSIALCNSNSIARSSTPTTPNAPLLRESGNPPSASGTSSPNSAEELSVISLHRPSHSRSHSCSYRNNTDLSSPSPARSRFRLSICSVLDAVKEVTSRTPSKSRGTTTSEARERGRTRVKPVANEHNSASTQASAGTGNRQPPRANTCPSHEPHLLGLGRVLGLERDTKKERDSHRKSKDCVEGWKEFEPGTYSYPISFLLPSNLPPTFSAPRGSLNYTLKAVAHRPGTFTSKLSCQVPLLVVAAPTAGAGEGGVPGDPGPLSIERQWESKLAYSFDLSSRLFLLGSQRHLGAAASNAICANTGTSVEVTAEAVYGTALLNLTLLPLEKIKIWRLSVIVDQHIRYFDGRKKLLRDEDRRQVKLLDVQDKCLAEELGLADDDSTRKNKNTHVQIPLLPTPLSPDRSPLLQHTPPSVDPSILAGPGPYTISTSIGLPHCGDRGLRFSMKHDTSYVKVEHSLRLVMRVENVGDRSTNDCDGAKKFDVTVQTPITVLSCRCVPEQQTLPAYSPAAEGCPACPCQPGPESGQGYRAGNEAGHVVTPNAGTSLESEGAGLGDERREGPRTSSLARPTMHVHSRSQQELTATVSATPPSSRPPSPLARYERLVSGLESEAGEAPPSYESIAVRCP